MALAKVSASGTGDATVESTFTKLRGFNITESAATPAAAEVVIRNGTSTSGAVVARVKLAASESAAFWFTEPVLCDSGVFVDRISGTTEVVVYIAG